MFLFVFIQQRHQKFVHAHQQAAQRKGTLIGVCTEKHVIGIAPDGQLVDGIQIDLDTVTVHQIYCIQVVNNLLNRAGLLVFCNGGYLSWIDDVCTTGTGE